MSRKGSLWITASTLGTLKKHLTGQGMSSICPDQVISSSLCKLAIPLFFPCARFQVSDFPARTTRGCNKRYFSWSDETGICNTWFIWWNSLQKKTDRRRIRIQFFPWKEHVQFFFPPSNISSTFDGTTKKPSFLTWKIQHTTFHGKNQGLHRS